MGSTHSSSYGYGVAKHFGPFSTDGCCRYCRERAELRKRFAGLHCFDTVGDRRFFVRDQTLLMLSSIPSLAGVETWLYLVVDRMRTPCHAVYEICSSENKTISVCIQQSLCPAMSNILVYPIMSPSLLQGPEGLPLEKVRLYCTVHYLSQW